MQAQHAGGERLSRRGFVGGLAGLGVSMTGLALVSSACSLAPLGKARPVSQVGFIFPRPLDARTATLMDAFRAGLQDYGYTEGPDIHFEWRYSGSTTNDDLPAIMADLIALGVDLIVTSGTTVAQAAKQATDTIPIIAAYVADPVAAGLVESLGRPGGNVTAISNFGPVLSVKRVELLRQIVPGLTRIGYVYNPASGGNVATLNELLQSAAGWGLSVRPIVLHALDDLEPGVEEAAQDGLGALMVPATGSIPPDEVHRRLAALALRHGLATMGFERTMPEAGGLISYGPDALAIYRRVGYYVDRILKGATPADLPVEQPTVFEVVVNTTTAKALGLAIPLDVAAQVTEWVQ